MTTLLAVAVGLAVIAAAINFVPAIIAKRRCRVALADRCRGKLSLTYDDGPDPLMTPKLVELLGRHAAKASFFLVGFRARRSPHMSALLRDSGHELGCHTNMHRNSWRVMPWTAARDVNQGYEGMAEWMPADAPFRPPFGKLVTGTWLNARRRHADICFWTHDGGDTWPVLPDPAAMARQIASADGAVVLMHSHDRGADRQAYVLTLTEHLLKAARDRGWRVCTMSEVLSGSGNTGGTHGREA